MSNLGNKYKVGALVLAGSTILVLGLLSLGAFKQFRTTYEFCTVVSTSVQGLAKGAKVKLKGVEIGEVKRVKIMESLDDIIIFMKFDPESFAESFSKKIDIKKIVRSGEILNDQKGQELIDKGLRAALKYDGITGNLYVEIDFYDPVKYPAREVKLPPESPPYLPSVQSTTIGSLIDETQKAVAKIAKVDFEGLSSRASEFLDNANGILKDKRVDSTLDRVESISKNLDELARTLNGGITKEHIESFMGEIKDTLANVNSAINLLRRTFEEMKLPEAAVKTKRLLDSSESFVRSAEAMRSQISESLARLNSSLEAARTLLDYIERNPNSILTGKPEKPIVEH